MWPSVDGNAVARPPRIRGLYVGSILPVNKGEVTMSGKADGEKARQYRLSQRMRLVEQREDDQRQKMSH
jgi:hypothetical protein